MEAYALWSIDSGEDPFHGEGGGQEEEEEEEEEEGEGGEEDGGRGAASVWLEYYVRVYHAR